MIEYATADDLIADEYRDTAGDVTLPNGKVVKVRGLTRHELFANGRGTEDNNVIEVRNLVSCMVEPKLTLPQAEAWHRAASVKTLQLVQDKIRELSGLAEGADKSDVAEVRD